jgi:hypothetical protein
LNWNWAMGLSLWSMSLRTVTCCSGSRQYDSNLLSNMGSWFLPSTSGTIFS